MKLLFDENLSPRLVDSLSDLYPDSSHVHECGLGSATDEAVWEYAKKQGLTIVSKDSEFEARSVFLGAPPEFIWIHARNCATHQVEQLLRTTFATVKRFVEEDDEACLSWAAIALQSKFKPIPTICGNRFKSRGDSTASEYYCWVSCSSLG